MAGTRAMGVVCIVSVVVLWVGSSELIQLIFDGNKFKFESPLFLTFYSTSLFSVYLLGFVFCKSWRRSFSGVCTGQPCVKMAQSVHVCVCVSSSTARHVYVVQFACMHLSLRFVCLCVYMWLAAVYLHVVYI